MMRISIYVGDMHNGQREVYESAARFRVLAAGRRWGKTRLGALEAILCAARGGAAWWVAPTYPIATIGWRIMTAWARRVPWAKRRESERRMEFPSGGWLQVKSADNPDSLRGEGLDLVVLDEAAFMKADAWNVLRPTLADRGGRALFISTPAGRNWFYDLWTRGQEGQEGWQSWQFPTAANPAVPAQDIEEARRTLPERVFRQEFLAEFIEDAGTVFRRVNECATAEWRDGPAAGAQYVFGVDWAQANDFTVITVLDVGARAVVHYDRFSQVDYVLQAERLKALAGKWRPTAILAEANAMGMPIVDALQRDGLPVQPFWTTAVTKTELIERLSLAFEQGAIRILPDPTLIRELQSYEMKRLPSGRFQYSAPAGAHDDCVMSLALAWYAASGAAGPAILEI